MLAVEAFGPPRVVPPSHDGAIAPSPEQPVRAKIAIAADKRHMPSFVMVETFLVE
jgi:hypothetical protein